jgi:hypothetical protein
MPFSYNPLLGVGLDKSIPLDGAGKIPSTYLPSYVDDVEEYNNLAAFPATGETGKIYVAIDTGFAYRWSGSVYVQIGITAAAGATTQVQFNDAGAFGGDSGLTFNKTTDALSAGGFIPTSSTVPANGVYLPAANSVGVATNGTGRLFISSAGLVGIGASAPSQLLSLASASNPFINIQDTTSATGSKAGISFTMTSVSGSSGARIEVERLGASAQSSLSFYTGGTLGTNVRALTIDQFQRVGIGSTAPQALLDVSASTGTRIRSTYTATTGTRDAGFEIFGDGAANSSFVYAGNTGVTTISSLLGTALNIGGTEALRVDSSRRLLVGTSSARDNFFNISGLGGLLQVEGANNNARRLISNVYGTVGAAGPLLCFGKHRGNSVGDNTVVESGDECGVLSFQGSDGTQFVEAAQISAYVDGTPGANDMPGRLVFSTTADGAASPTERMRIKSAGTINFSNVSTYADNTAALAGGLVAGDVYRKSDGTLMITY